MLADFRSLSLGGTCSTLCLLGLLCALGSSLLLLALLDSSETSGGTGLWSLRSSLLDNVEGSTNDGTLSLDCAAGSLLGNFLFVVVVSALSSSAPIRAHFSPTIFCCVSTGFGGSTIPQRYPSCAVFGKEQSMQFGGDSCAGGRGTRSCRSGNGRSCCRHERRACPVNHPVSTSCSCNSMPVLPMRIAPIYFVLHRDRRSWIVVPFQGRSSHRRRYRRRYAY